MTLVDTSVWIDWLRGDKSPAALRLDRLIDEDDIVLAGVIVQELLQGARGADHLAKLRRYFERLQVLLPSQTTFAEAGTLYARCRWAGITPRSGNDCLIAQTAIEHDVRLLHDDAGFERIAQVEPRLRLLRR